MHYNKLFISLFFALFNLLSLAQGIGEWRDHLPYTNAKTLTEAGDRIYWPIFNLDVKNPNAPEEETHDPDVLLEKYKKLLGEIEETENQLQSELAAALAHHFVGEDA